MVLYHLLRAVGSAALAACLGEMYACPPCLASSLTVACGWWVVCRSMVEDRLARAESDLENVRGEFNRTRTQDGSRIEQLTALTDDTAKELQDLRKVHVSARAGEEGGAGGEGSSCSGRNLYGRISSVVILTLIPADY